MVRARNAAAAAPPEDPRARVLTAARGLFAARGFDGTTVQDVADALGVSKPAVLHHFASKELLRAAVLDDLLSHWNRELPRLLLAATASDGRFDAVFDELTRFFFDHPDRARVVLREVLDRPSEVRALLAKGVRPWLAAIAGYVRSGVASGRHHADVDPEAYVAHTMMLVLTASASVDLMPSALDAPPAAALVRARDELRRLARAALFTPHESDRSAPSRSTKPPAPARAARRTRR